MNRFGTIILSILVCLSLSLSGACADGQSRQSGEGVRLCGGLKLIRQEKSNPANVVIPIESCRLEGFIQDTAREYPEDNVRRTGAKGRIIATVPQAGRWFVGLIFYDGELEERFRIRVGGRDRGIMFGDLNDNREYLFVLTEQLPLAKGDKIELETLTSKGTYRTEDLILLAELPPTWRPAFQIKEVAATVRRDNGGGGVGITWITTWPASGRVEYGPTSNYGKVAEQPHWLNCHRVVLTELQPNTTYHYRIVCPKKDGGEISTPDATFLSTAPAVAGSVRRGLVELEFVRNRYSGPGFLPVTGGVPLPKGALGSAENVRLLTAGGVEVPAQVRISARWPDGTVKWLLVDCQPGFGQEGPAKLILEYGTQVSRKSFSSPLAVREDSEAITVTTGPARFEVSKKFFGPFAKVWADANSDGSFAAGELISAVQNWGGSVLRTAEGIEYSSLLDQPERVVVEESGPLRVTVLVAGRHRAADGRRLFTYQARIHTYAGKPYVRMHYSFCNDNTSRTFTDIGSIILRFPLKKTGSIVPTFGRNPQGKQWAVSQLTADLYEVVPDQPQQVNRGRLRGRLGLDDGRRTVGVAVRNFWQLYPKRLALSPQGIEIGICPPLRKEFYQNPGPESHRLYYYLKTGNYRLKYGCGKRHELLFSFGSQDFEADARMLENPPILRCDSWWYAKTKVFGDIAPAKQLAYPQYDALAGKAMEQYLANRRRNREYGMLNFGDWWGERGINWGNLEYDSQHAFLLQWIRTGDLRFFLSGQQAARHYMDTDLIRFHPSDRYVGAVYTHCIGHVGGYYNRSPIAQKGSLHGNTSVAHSWTQGFFDYYFLTGDRRSLQAGLMLADHYNLYGTTNYDFSNCRGPGWHLILTVAAYRATGDPYYLNAATIICERVLERQTPDGGWQRQLVPGHCLHHPAHRGNAGFMVGILMTGLKMLHQETHDPRIIDSLAKASHFILKDMWEDQVKGFRYTSCPTSSKGTWSNFLIFEGILYAYRHTGDWRLGRYAQMGMDAAMGLGLSGFGKTFSLETRAMPYILYEMDRMKNSP